MLDTCSDGKFKDLTQKYDSKWMTGTAKLRVSDKWWQKTIAPYRPQESKKTKEEDSQLQSMINAFDNIIVPSSITTRNLVYILCANFYHLLIVYTTYMTYTTSLASF